ncbi:MAG: Na+/H+ antiporter NhaA, partial [Paracoccaceae bacterium]
TLVWLMTSTLIETAAEASFGAGWAVPLGSDVVLGYVIGRLVFGSGHPAVHLLLLIAIGQDILGLILLGVIFPGQDLAPIWLLLPILASGGVWLLVGRRVRPDATERHRQAGMALWPYILAGAVSWVGVALAGLPPALGLLPVIPAIPHAERSFGLFAEAEVLLHDPLNRLAHALIPVMPFVLFGFGLTRGGIDLGAWAPTTASVLAAMWIGKPLGLLGGALAAIALAKGSLPPGIHLRDLCLIAVILCCGFTIPVLAIDSALPGGGMAEAARLGLALSLLAAPVALGLARLWHPKSIQG